MLTDVLAMVAAAVCGAAFGYSLCRKLLHGISLNEVGPYQTAKIFGYPPPKSPAIAELEEILKNAD